MSGEAPLYVLRLKKPQDAFFRVQGGGEVTIDADRELADRAA